MNRWLLDVLDKERRQRGEETVGSRFLIHALDDCKAIEAKLGEELLAQRFWKLFLEHITHQKLTQYSATTLIAKDIAQR